MRGADYFSKDYAGARSMFQRLARSAGIPLDGYAITGKGPGGETLATDIAWVGNREARQVLVVQSGVHGVEAFAGSAVQCSLLEHPPSGIGDPALVLVHVVNPWGMAWLRRTNASNVDLNRNCLGPTQSYSGAPPGYEKINGLINPGSPPAKDMFKSRAAHAILRQGRAALKQAVAGGQYEFPMGLFYGGARLQEEPALLQRWTIQRLAPAKRLLVLDIHTGLGRRGEHLVFPAFPMKESERRIVEARFGCPLQMVESDGDRYPVTGSVSGIYRRNFPDIDLHYFTVEFGTEPPLDVLAALRNENRHHFHSGGLPGHWSKVALKRALCPDSPDWKERVVADGRRLVAEALRYAGRGSNGEESGS